MPLMKMAEYAIHRGVSKAAVSYAVRDGRIKTTTDHAGKRVIDSDAADIQWNQNTAHDKRRNTDDSRAGIAPLESAPIPGQNARSGIEVEAPAPGVQIGFSPKDLLLPERPPVGANETNYANARAHKEHYMAKQAELDYLEAAGKLVDVATIQKEWSSVAASVRTKVLGIPSKAKQRIPDLSHDQYLAIEKLVRESLEDLAGEAQE